MTKWLLFALMLWANLVLRAETVKLNKLQVGFQTYSNVTVLGANDTDLYFKHSYGFANVKLKYLSPEIQKRFNYNAKTAEEAERRQTESELLYQTGLARAASAKSTAEKKTKPEIGSKTGLADPTSDHSLLGKPGPKFEVDKWLGEKPELDGKYLLLSFWAPWSLPCRQFIPTFNALQKKFANKMAIVGVSNGTEDELGDVSELKIEYALAIDTKAKLSALSGVTSIPFVLLSDPKGNVLYQGHPAALTEKKLQAILASSSE